MHSNGNRAWPLLQVLGFATLLALLQTPAQARLGGDATTIRDDSVRLHGQLISTPMLQYERHDITTSAGGVIHEYQSRSGTVFAVTWQAPLPPDLRQIFGNYFETFRAAEAAQSRPGTHRQAQVLQSDFVFRAAGRMRAFTGRAYVPSLVPAGVDADSLP